ncbi:50S_ribosome-binding_GTPase/Dynamin_family/Elongation_factor_Tu_GTP_binding_domain_containing_protein_-_putative [Leishmania infantum]|uniref:50S_ribosome-binding_GTPase/Dynamin_family/Elonga tion_factor_Tu_GTP_binding_domain_containing_protein_-_putative n=1 Tax=Leishmania infantum TaxID=5671 RepID=A0A6L0XDI4_LEIIN|nr:50S_ribosome-binding_GTPase/Dynamin_family/Elongation_factor_Tu_GTP_binding_domain_containing_protein_-_putative [Leishmania infantum]SUZ41771.1 50S_ribosome-binding_GTPase/Dynamin_family/Elongation_factor_Tu_GTP_binding_domain_containing_protein_-_putative [Leishmania infantum]
MFCLALRSIHGACVPRASAVRQVPLRRLTTSAGAAAAAILAPVNACCSVHQRRHYHSLRHTPVTELEQSTWKNDDVRGQHRPLLSSKDDHHGTDAAASSRYLTANGISRGAVHTTECSHSAVYSRQPPGSLQTQRQKPPRPRRPSALFMSPQEAEETTAAASSSLAPLPADEHVADVQDDDIVLDTPASLLPCMAERGASTSELRQAAQRAHHHQRRSGGGGGTDAAHEPAAPEKSEHAHPAARGVGQDVIDLVTDVFTAQRDAEIKKRREVLYELTHPNPIDYTYNGKLVPPPPLSFGQVTEEARALGNKIMLGQTYSLVRQAGTRASADDFDVIGSSASTAGRGAAAAVTIVSPASSIEAGLAAPLSTFSSRHAKGYGGRTAAAPYRSRARDANIFRDHNYFFEINELYQEVAFAGRACAGKSSLLNALLGQHVAKTSSTPNTTRKISFYQSVTPEQLHAFHVKEHHNQLVKLPGGGLQLTFVDLPGYGIEGMSDKWRDAAIELTDAYFGVRRSVNTVLYCMDCERGLTKTDIKYLEWIENVHGACFMVLTKCDSVPHSRVCSVMRQVYALITKHRHKYRKVFPFIIPVSAKDGTNIELLRGLITETAGIIPGDKLRELLQHKKAAFTRTALLAEVSRIDAARQLERDQAKVYFQLTCGGTSASAAAELPPEARCSERPGARREREVSGGASAGAQGTSAERGATLPPNVDASETAASPSDAALGSCHRRYVLPLGNGAADAEAAALLSGCASDLDAAGDTADFFPTESSMAAAAAEGRRERRERFLAWRRAHPLRTVSPSYSAIHGQVGYDATRPVAASEQEAGLPGSGRYRLNTGLDNPRAAHAVLELHGGPDVSEGECGPRGKDGEGARHGGGDAEARNSRATAVASAGESSHSPPPALPIAAACHGRRFSVIGLSDVDTDGSVAPGAAASAAPPAVAPPSSLRSASTGTVSRFLDVMEQYGRQHNVVSSAKQKRREERWRRRGGGGGARGRHCAVGGLLAEDASGRLSAYRAGRPCGPALVSTNTDVDRRQAEWRAEQLKTLLAKENPEAPWAALHQLRRKIQAREEETALAGMRKKEVAAYVRNAGRVTASFEKFEGEVTAAKYMNEIRQAPTLRSQQQMHLNATAKINYRSMPPGLWKRYGEKDTYWQTPQLLGRSEDESHR